MGVVRRTFEVCSNELRRKIVNSLFGNELILEHRKTDQGDEVQLIDLQRRMNYGYEYYLLSS